MSIDSKTPEGAQSAESLTRSSSPQSRKQKRLSKHLESNGSNSQLVTTSNTQQQPHHPPLTLIPNPSLHTMPPSRLLIASIGNPAPYLSTLHSAGHTVLFALATYLSSTSPATQPPLQKSPSRDWAHGLLSHGDPWTLWASPVHMNISGPAVSTAWKTFLSTTGRPSSSARAGAGAGAAAEPQLVILHDELEAPLGSVRVRPGSSSPKGHNGLKSIREKMPGVRYTRIGIGIGRPESRSPEVVAGYVLRKMTVGERRRVEGCVGEVLEALRGLGGGGGGDGGDE